MPSPRAVIDWKAIVADVTPTRDRVIGGLRCALAMAIAAFWGMAIELPQAYWGIISAALLSQPLATTTTARTLMRVSGTAIGGIIAVSMAAAFLGNPPAYLVCLGIVCFCAGYLWTGSRYPYAVAVFSLTVMLITYGGITDPTNVQSIAWYRTLEVSTGAIAVAIATAIIPGERAFARLLRLSESKVRRLAHGLDPLIDSSIGRTEVELTLEPAAAERYMALHELLQLAQGEDSDVWMHRARWFELIGAIERTRITLDDVGFAASGPDAQRVTGPVRTELVAVARALQSSCERLAGELRRAGTASAGDTTLDTAGDDADAAIQAVHGRVQELRDSHAMAALTTDDAARLYGLVQSLDSAVRDVQRSHELLQEIREVQEPARELQARAAEAAGVFAILPVEPFKVRHGMKNAIASVTGLLLALTIPGGYGSSVMMTVALLSATPNFGAMIQKSVLRFAGTLIGGALAIAFIVVVIPNVFSVGGLLLNAAPILFLCGYLLCCGARVAYAGLQMALTFGIVVLPTDVPSTNLWPATDRLIGVCAGAAVVGLVFNFIAPHRAMDDYRDGMANLCRAIADYVRIIAALRAKETVVESARFGIRRRVYSAAARVTESVAGMDFDRSNLRSGLSDHDLAVAPSEARVMYRATIALSLGRPAMPESPPEEVRAAVEAALGAIGGEIEAIASLWDKGGGTLDPVLPAARRAAISAVDQAMSAERQAHAVLPMSTTEAEAFVGQVAHLARMSAQLDAMGEIVRRLGGLPAADPEPQARLEPIASP
jgi:multidrug resistance protein MdtO